MKKINELFFYTFETWINLAAGTALERSIVTDGDSDFILADIFGIAYPTGTLTGAVPFLLSIRDDYTTKAMTNRLTISPLIASSTAAINPLPVYRLFRGKSTVSATISNPGAAGIDVYLSLRGYKIPMNSAQMVNLTR